VEDEIKIMSEC